MSDKYVPGTDTVRHVYAGAPKLQNEPDGYRAGREAAFDRWLAAERARVWDEALADVWELNDPVWTVVTQYEIANRKDIPVLTARDIAQASRENPYREGF